MDPDWDAWDDRGVGGVLVLWTVTAGVGAVYTINNSNVQDDKDSRIGAST